MNESCSYVYVFFQNISLEFMTEDVILRYDVIHFERFFRVKRCGSFCLVM